MTFLECVKIILDHEGGRVNHPDDPGKETNWGISQNAFPDLNITSLTKEEAIQIYESAYWNRLNLQHLNPKIRLIIFDAAVNQGPGRAGIFLQRACNMQTDGVIGPKTIKASEEYPPEHIISSIARQRLEAYIRNEKWSTFGKGWTKRLLDITLISLRGS